MRENSDCATIVQYSGVQWMMSYSRRLAVLIRRGFVLAVSGGAILDCMTLLHKVVLRVVPKLSTFTLSMKYNYYCIFEVADCTSGKPGGLGIFA